MVSKYNSWDLTIKSTNILMRKYKKLLRNCYNFNCNCITWQFQERKKERKKERNEGTNQKSNKETMTIDNLANENEGLRELIVGWQLMNLQNK